jgi:alginate O-acetyltransferase complex protein AlgI
MLFNSFAFVLFFFIVYTAYLLLHRRLAAQNFLLAVASFVFYGYWNWRFLILVFLSAFWDYLAGLGMERVKHPGGRKAILLASACANLGVFFYFKYWNFFSDSVARMIGLFGFEADFVTLHVILPLGISFSTFQSLSYTIDVYRRELKPVRNPIDYFAYVTYFPQMVAGPIERGNTLITQFLHRRRITADQVHAGLFLILWGYFKKVVVADNVGPIANSVFNNPHWFHGADIVLGILAFAVQIYGDFSGYSDIARGMAKLMGFELMVNFKLPFFALSPQDFWRRWHISLSTWLRDYLYIPLGGNRKGPSRTYANLLLTMVLGGLWHGAALHFAVWGFYHGLLLVAYRLVDRDPVDMDLWSGDRPKPYVLAKMAVMFVLTMIGWVLFRASSLRQAAYILTHAGLDASRHTAGMGQALLFFAAPLVVVEWWQYVRRDQLAPVNLRLPWRVSAYAAMLVWVLIFGVRESLEFIYFQF